MTDSGSDSRAPKPRLGSRRVRTLSVCLSGRRTGRQLSACPSQRCLSQPGGARGASGQEEGSCWCKGALALRRPQPCAGWVLVLQRKRFPDSSYLQLARDKEKCYLRGKTCRNACWRESSVPGLQLRQAEFAERGDAAALGRAQHSPRRAASCIPPSTATCQLSKNKGRCYHSLRAHFHPGLAFFEMIGARQRWKNIALDATAHRAVRKFTVELARPAA